MGEQDPVELAAARRVAPQGPGPVLVEVLADQCEQRADILDRAGPDGRRGLHGAGAEIVEGSVHGQRAPGGSGTSGLEKGSGSRVRLGVHAGGGVAVWAPADLQGVGTPAVSSFSSCTQKSRTDTASAL